MAGITWAVVIPTIRPKSFKKFLAAWNPLFIKHNVHLVVLEDDATRHDLGLDVLANFTHLCRADVPNFIPTQTDMIRSWGFYHVWNYKLATHVLTLDDDVTPVGDPFAEYERVFLEGSVFSEYLSVGALTNSRLQMRGFPYKDRKPALVAVQYGGWDGVLDYDAATQLAVPMTDQTFERVVMPVPKGVATTCCIMNCAFDATYTPIMWQLPMLEGRYNRVGDIWSGLFIKRVLDVVGAVMVINGQATVRHERASDPYSSLAKEAPSVQINDELWANLPPLPHYDLLNAYRLVTTAAYNSFMSHDEAYADHFMWARDEWLKLFS